MGLVKESSVFSERLEKVASLCGVLLMTGCRIVKAKLRAVDDGKMDFRDEERAC
jgi:hypothetical protein